MKVSGKLRDDERGWIGWMVENRVTPNLLMIVLLLGGALAFFFRMQKEVFPTFELDTVTIDVTYQGAGPEEVENSIVEAIEAEITGIDGVKEIRATANEGRANITAELIDGSPRQEVLQDIQQAVDSITTLPADSERPVVKLSRQRREVLDLQIFGDVDARSLRAAAEEIRDALLRHPSISQIDLEDTPDYEIIVEVPSEALRRYNVTLIDIENAIRQHSQEIPSGKVETKSGEVLLRLSQRSDWGKDYAKIPIINDADGTLITLGDIANVSEGFEEVDKFAIYNGKRNITLEVYRVGDQTPVEVSEAVRAEMEKLEATLPTGVEWYVPNDRSNIYQDRRDLLMKNLAMGLALVLLVLGLFLEIRLAFWVMMGIPISFLGALLFLPEVGITFNIISMFAFIVAVGIVVDDAIVVGENIYEYRERGMSYRRAAILGAKNVSTPVIFAINTNLIAFTPLAFLPGRTGKIWVSIPFVVNAVFLMSLLESLLILPAHLAHGSKKPLKGVLGLISKGQQAFANWFKRMVTKYYGPLIVWCVRFRIATISFMLGTLIFAMGYFNSGRLAWQPFPSPESDSAVVTVNVPLGAPPSQIFAVNERLLKAADKVVAENGGETLSFGTRTRVDGTEVQVSVYLTDPETRPISTSKFVDLWRAEVGELVNIQNIRFESDRGGPGGGPALNLQLSHKDVPVLERAAQDLAAALEAYPVVKEVDSGVSLGKRQLDYRLKADWENVGLTASEVARQVRAAYQGTTSIRQQRGANEVTLRVRLPDEERTSIEDISNFYLKTNEGKEVRFVDVAEVLETRAFKAIERVDGRRTMAITADVTDKNESQRVMNDLAGVVLPQLMKDYPGLTWKPRGRRADVNDALHELLKLMAMAFAVIYFVLAIPFRNYTQPFIVMVAIPFGMVGAVIGHMLMGYTASLISVLGVIALSGVVLNDSLVLVTYANDLRRDEGLTAFQAIHAASVRRFRPIMLTTL
ncbi:MAG: efflux RND transporter permease subunit, partial [Planctomycetes bacterium]|nr:efflux RND transporter permease subunit [Planctomycetota bacterium]